MDEEGTEQPRVQRNVAAVALAVVAAVVAVVIISVMVHSNTTSALTNGPIGQRRGFEHVWTPTIEVGATKTDGLERLVVSGNAPAIITDVQWVGDDKAMKYLGTMIAGPTRKGGQTQLFDQYPPVAPRKLGPIEPARGAVLKPNDAGYELLIGFKYVKDVVGIRNTVIVSYLVEGKQYQVDLHAALYACPTTMKLNTCTDESTKLID